MKLGSRDSYAGFTVVEVLIVLAVTGALFLAAAIMISGRQNQTAFDQAIQNVQSQIQATINGVAVGFYPEKGSFSCNAGGAGVPPNLTNSVSGQGTNSGCIFLGQALQFRLANSDPEEFVSYTIAGLKRGGAGDAESSILSDARPQIVSASISHPDPYPDNSVTEELNHGLKTARMWYNNGAGDQDIGAVAFVICSPIGANDCRMAQFSGGNILSGSTSVSVVAIPGTSLNAEKTATVQAMNSDGGNGVAAGVINPTGGVFICFESGGTNDWGIVQIGGGGRELAVNVRIKDKTGGTCDNS